MFGIIDALCNKDYDLNTSNQFVEDLKKKLKGHRLRLDDVVLAHFEGENKNKLPLYKNKNLLVTLLLAFVWERMHRDVFWNSRLDNEVWLVNENLLLKMQRIVMRVKGRLGDEQKTMLEAVQLLLAACFRDYHAVRVAAQEIKKNGYPKNAYMYSYFIGANSFFYDLTYNPVAPAKNISGDEFDFSHIEFDSTPTILLSCDTKYFESFSEHFISSAKNLLNQYRIVFIIIGGSSAKLGSNIYTVGVDFQNFTHSPALYASVRFIAARELLSKSNSPVLIFDIDFKFSSQMEFLINSLSQEKFDIGLCFNKKYRAVVPWSAIPAAACYFNDTNYSIMFLDYFIEYFCRCWDDKQSNWWIDQNALFYAYHKMHITIPSLVIKNVVEIRDLGATNGDEETMRAKYLIHNL